MSAARASSLTSSSPFASMGPDLLASGMLPLDDRKAELDDAPVEVLEDFGDSGAYEDDADLDPLSAMEKYCRSSLPQHRLAYTAGMGAAVQLLQPHEVSGSVIALLRELLGDVYADVRLAALQQVLPVARRLRSVGSLYQSDIETLWDLVQKLLLDADVENQEAASAVFGELSHIVATGNAVVASQKLVTAVQKLQRLPVELQAEGALAALRLIAEVVAPRAGSPLTFSTIQEFSVTTFKDMIRHDSSPDVRQAVALLLPHFAKHMPPALCASLVPGWVKTLAGDSHWNVRAEVPQLLISLLRPQDPGGHKQQQLQEAVAAADGSSAGSGALEQPWSVGAEAGRHMGVRAGPTSAAVGSVAASWSPEGLRLVSDVAERLCKDTALQVKVAALASLGVLLPLLPPSLITTHKALLGNFVSTARPAANLAGIKVPLGLCAPGLSGHAEAMRTRQRQQRRQQQQASHDRKLTYEEALFDLIKEMDDLVCRQPTPGEGQASTASGEQHDAELSDHGGISSSSSSTSGDSVSSLAKQDEAQQERWLLQTANDTPVGGDDADSPGRAEAGEGGSSSAAGAAAAGTSGEAAVAQQHKTPPPAPGTAAAELPRLCALHIGKVALQAGPEAWQQLQRAFLELAVAAIQGNYEVAAALLAAFPGLSAALGHDESKGILVPVALELLHTQLDAVTPVLSMMLLDVVTALPPELRICLLQLLPHLVLQTDAELTGSWRARLAVAEQLSAVARAVTCAQTAYCLWPLLLLLARDPVYAVRAAAARQAGLLLLQLPEQELPPECSDVQKAAAAAAALRCNSAQPSQHPAAAEEGGAACEGAASGSGPPAGADVVEHMIAAAVATHAVDGSQPEQQAQLTQQQQQQQQQPGQDGVQGGATQRLRWMRRGLTSSLSSLQQQMDKVMESHGLQKALNGVDQQLAWLQQHPQGKMLWNLGSRLAQGVRGSPDSTAGAGEPPMSAAELRRQLTSVQVMDAAVMDPCKYLLTPPWHELAQELLPLCTSESCGDRIVFVTAACSVLAAQQQRQQVQHLAAKAQLGEQQQGQHSDQKQGHGGEQFLQQLLLKLQQLSQDPTPGVRWQVTSAIKQLLDQGMFAAQDSELLGRVCSSSSSTGSVRSTLSSSAATSSTASPVGGAAAPQADRQDNSCSSNRSPANLQLQQQQPGPGSCSGGGINSIGSSSVAAAPASSLALLQDCLQRLRRDPCASVATAAQAGGASGALADSDESNAGAAVAAAAAADAAVLASSPPQAPWAPAGGDAEGLVHTRTAEGTDLL